jgi:hypothetical protein
MGKTCDAGQALAPCHPLAPRNGDLSGLGGRERNLPKAKARRAERAGASESLRWREGIEI